MANYNPWGFDLFMKYPYLLACMVTGSFSVVGLIAAYYILPETRATLLTGSSGTTSGNLRLRSVDHGVGGGLHEATPIVPETAAGNFKFFFKDPIIFSSVLLYCTFSFADIGFYELFSLWAATDHELGG